MNEENEETERMELRFLVCANCGNDNLSELEARTVEHVEGDYVAEVGNVIFFCRRGCGCNKKKAGWPLDVFLK